ncbi:MAG: TetR/AcrR family transcriptional regulator [Desulfotignum sp.]|nr:TetR/AcrR family transcriptional regulator [Desulfotignum sp.]MCF8137488.1 TetR/AcrR family transcriptional regulator [Desulfotignum sp.]
MQNNNGKKQAILRAAQEIFAEKGLAKATISEIAKKADVVDSIIYHYFTNKQDLLFSSIEELIEKSHEELLFHFKGLWGPVSQLGKMVWFHLYENDFSSGDARKMKNLLFECRSNKDYYNHTGYKALQRYAGVMLDILKKGVKEKYFREDLEINITRDMIFGFLDEESLSCLAYREIDETLPDFESIMSLIMAMIGIDTDGMNPVMNPEIAAAVKNDRNDKAERVSEAAVSIFARKGHRKTTMLEIAEHAGVAEGTIYEYFKNKQELLFSIPRNKFLSFQVQLKGVFTVKDPLEKLRSFVWEYFRIFSSDSDFLMIFLCDIKLNKRFYNTEAFGAFLDTSEILYDILDEGKACGVFRQDLSNRVFRNLFLGAFSHLCIRWFVLERVSPIRMMSELASVTDLLCRAVVPKSEKIIDG